MKKNIEANSKLIKGGIQFIKGKIAGSRMEKLRGISNIVRAQTTLKVLRLLK